MAIGIESVAKNLTKITIDLLSPLLHNLFGNVQYKAINPFAFILISNIWKTSKSEVIRLIDLFDKCCDKYTESFGTDLGSNIPIVTELEVLMMHLLYSHFQDRKLSAVEAKKWIPVYVTWYLIIYLMHLNEAVKVLVCNRTSQS